jgi:hypothetical protein
MAPPLERQGLDLLLAKFPEATVYHAGRPLVLDRQMCGTVMETPWLACDLTVDGTVRKFAIWKTTGAVYELDEHGAVMEDTLFGYPCAVCGFQGTCGDPPGEDCHS